MTSLYDCGTDAGSANVFVGSTAPATPADGDVWFDTTINVWKRWDGARWVTTSGGGGLPAATKRNQLLVSGAAPTFDWAAADDYDEGRF